MKKYQKILLTVLMTLILTCSISGCSKYVDHKQNKKVDAEVDTKSEPSDENSIEQKTQTKENTDVKTNFQTVSEDDIKFKDDFVIPDYDTISKDKNSSIAEAEGTFGGSPVTWFSINNNGILYFYYQFTDTDPKSEPEYMNYAIVGEDYTLSCGLHVGMTKEEVYEIIPDGVSCKPYQSEGTVAPGVMPWNSAGFPEGWCESYDDIIMTKIEYDEELPWYLGLLLDEDGEVRAITTCYPTAG